LPIIGKYNDDNVLTCKQEGGNILQALRREANQDDEEIHQLEQRIRWVDEEEEELGENKDGSNAWTPETRELWQECVGLKNKNNRI
jgi:hypothetical protein